MRGRKARAAGIGIVGAVTLVTVLALTTADERQDSALQPDPAPTGVASPTPSSPDPAEPEGLPLLLPNMRSLGAGDLQVEGTDRGRRLRFSASLANLGPGPLLLRPYGRAACPDEQHGAVQVLYEDGNRDGVYQHRRDRVGARRAAGCMLRHQGHDHWHFDAMASYSLRLAGADEPLVSRRKVSFCLRDNERVPNQPVVVRREHFGECSRRSKQGISPGWVDIYSADLSGQTLRLPPGIDDRLLCLDLEADPRRLLVETDETDNATSVGIRISGDSVRRAPSEQCR